MLREDIRHLSKATPRDLRKFGLVVGVVFCLVGIWLGLRHRPYGWHLLLPGALLVILGGILPQRLRRIYAGWMTLAMVMGAVVSTLLLTVLFYGVVTPLRLMARLAGRDFLSRKLNPRGESYWIPRDSKPKQNVSYERQY